MLTSQAPADTKRLPMMPIRDVVFFPQMMIPFVVGRKSSVKALAEAVAGDKKIFLATQRDASVAEPKVGEIYSVGTIANIVQSLKLPDGNIKILVEGLERGKVLSVADDEGFFRATVRTGGIQLQMSPQLDALISRVTDLFEQYVKHSQNLNYETVITAIRVDDPGKLADTIGANLQLTIEEKQQLLEIFDPPDRLARLAEKLTTLNIANVAVRLPFEVRAVFPDDTTEVMPTAAALHKAQAMGLDLILIAPDATPPVARVMDYEQWLREHRQKH